MSDGELSDFDTEDYHSDCKATRATKRRNGVIDNALNVLFEERRALSHVANLYQTCLTAQSSLISASDTILASQASKGKLLFCGVGKSAYIAQKLTATCKSLSVRASFLHAVEAVHGDLGDIGEVCTEHPLAMRAMELTRQDDVVLFVSQSGRTPELLNLLPHIPQTTHIMAISCMTSIDDCRLLAGRNNVTLLPAPIPESELSCFGVSAPTSSTTVALAVGDMLALTIARGLHDKPLAVIFRRNHPGGAIGIDAKGDDQEDEVEDQGPLGIEPPSPSISGSDLA